MTVEEFRGLLGEYLVPMFPGSSLGDSSGSTANHQLVSYAPDYSLQLKPNSDANYRIRLTRSQRYTPDEKRLVALFIDELSEIVDHAGADFFRDVMAALPRRVISNFLSKERGRRTFERAIQLFEGLASQTYEGRPVVSALGMTGSTNYGHVTIGDLWGEDFARVLSNGFDSLYVCGSDGKVFSVDCLPPPPSVQFSPHRLGSIAEWCHTNSRVAIVLNRNGELLVFKDRKLQFARRRGAWRYYPHDSVVSRLGFGNTASLRRAVYESCLDVSFARTGGCVAVIGQKALRKLDRALAPGELIKQRANTRTKLLSSVITKKFQALDRRLRQAIVSMDGATVLSNTGEVLTAGSIVRVPGGSTGGGRRAAAIQLSKIGVALKISADGPITGFKKGKEILAL